MPSTPQFLPVAGRRLAFRAVPGDLNLPVLVLLHEGLGCVELWRDFPEQLNEATGHPVLLYSRFGYGASDPQPLPWPLDYMQREGLLVLPAVLTAAVLRSVTGEPAALLPPSIFSLTNVTAPSANRLCTP